MSNPEPNAPLLDLSDLKFQPSWVNESSDHSRYFGAAEQGDRPRRDDRGERRGPRPPRFEGGGQGRGPGTRAPQQRDSRPPRPGGQGGQAGERRSFPPREGQQREGGRDNRGGDRRDGRGPGQGFRPREERRPAPPPPPAVKVEFLPDPNVLGALAQQIKNSHMTFPLFGLARKFLEKPEYHSIRITAVEKDGQPAPTLYRIGEDGPVVLDKRAAERIAYEREKGTLFEEKTELGEAPKGNFTNVARCRLDGTLLGPTNHHAFQGSLRALYEGRYSRRMSFEQFRREIETVSDPAEVEKWKEQSRASTTLTVVGSEPPITLNSPAEARRWFEENRLPALLQSGPSFIMKGVVARQGADPALGRAIGGAWDDESRHPLNLVQVVRSGLQKAGLQIFKHRKKFVYVSGVRPVAFRAETGSAVSPTVQQILEIIGASPGISRKALAERVLGPAPAEKTPEPAPSAEPAAGEEAVTAAAPPSETAVSETAVSEAPVSEAPAAETSVPETQASEAPVPAAPAVTLEDPYTRAKSLLIADLRWLTAAGHIIALHDGTYDLPPSPQAKPAPAPNAGKASATAAPAVAAAAAVEESIGEDPDAAAVAAAEAAAPAGEVAQEPAAEEAAPAEEKKTEDSKPAAITPPADTPVPGWAE